jgi:hypothetical protein
VRGRALTIGLVLALAGGIALSACGESGSTGPDAEAVQLVAQLEHHDERGVVIANQAAAQSPSPELREAAAELAERQRQRAEWLDALLDDWAVPAAERRELDPADVPTAAESAALASCTLIKDPDAVSKLANTPAVQFDAEYDRLASDQLSSAVRLVDEIAASGALSSDEQAQLEQITAGVGAA